MDRVKRMRPTGEVLPQRSRHRGEPAQPPPDRRRRPAKTRSDTPVPVPTGLRGQRRADDLDPITPAQQTVLRDQHVRRPADPADRAPQTATLNPNPKTHLALNAMSPRPQTRPAPRTRQPAVHQVRLDGDRVDPYDDHSGAPASSGRASSRSVERMSEEALARSDRAHAALTTPPSTKPDRRPAHPHRRRRRHHEHQPVLTYSDAKQPNDDQRAWRLTTARSGGRA